MRAQQPSSTGKNTPAPMPTARRKTPAFPLSAAALAFACGLALAPAQTARAQTAPSQAAPIPGSSEAELARGAYLFRAANCQECHTDVKNKGTPLAGGRPLPTPFGSFYTPNITPDPETGIGRWSEADFRVAMQKGVAPDGSNYFPAFPYTSFAKITEADLHALWLYLRAQPPVKQANKPHDIRFPFNIRLLVLGWKTLYFDGGPFKPDPAKSAEINRGDYLVNALGHCAECHSPRNALGGIKAGMRFGGSDDGAEGASVPNISPHPKLGIGSWSQKDIADFLESGATPEFDYVGGLMGGIVAESTKYLTEADRMAIGAYLKSLPPVDFAPKGRKKGS